MKRGRNPTMTTLQRIQKVLEEAPGPLTRYEIHKRLRGAVNPQVIEAALGYLSSLSLIHDEGPRGRVLWIYNPSPRFRELVKRSRRVA